MFELEPPFRCCFVLPLGFDVVFCFCFGCVFAGMFDEGREIQTKLSNPSYWNYNAVLMEIAAISVLLIYC